MSKHDLMERAKYHSVQRSKYQKLQKQLDLIGDLPDDTPWTEAERILRERLSRPNYEETTQ